MFSRKKNKALSLFLIAGYLFGFGLHNIFHNELFIFSGSAEQQVFPHQDADHCRHIPLSANADCPICLSHQSSTTPDHISFLSVQLQIVGKSVAIPDVPLLHSHLLQSFSRRGPPASSLG
jgi:hypothetical protein